MRKVIGIGETTLDIIFQHGQPTAAVPGGSVFNGIVSLARARVPVVFISETGRDHVGDITRQFMRDNGIPTDHMGLLAGGKSAVSLAFLNERNEASYIFYRDYPRQRLDVDLPAVTEDDIVILGSYYALNPVVREKIVDLLDRARQARAIVYYDPNFRSSHREEAIKLAPTIIENLEYADIVRGSREDFYYMYGLDDADKVYREKVRFYCPNFLFTAGSQGIQLRTRTFSRQYPVPPIDTVSTVGAGDNFNAGVLLGLLRHDVRRAELYDLDAPTWDAIVASGMAFAAEVCRTLDNSISREFAAAIAREH